jgi:hypothetical protein
MRMIFAGALALWASAAHADYVTCLREAAEVLIYYHKAVKPFDLMSACVRERQAFIDGCMIVTVARRNGLPKKLWPLVQGGNYPGTAEALRQCTTDANNMPAKMINREE